MTSDLIQRGIHEWFGLTRSAYFVVPRLALEAMPAEWQARFIALMDEAEQVGLETPSYLVLRGDPGYTLVTRYDEDDPGSRDYEFIALQEDEWANYRHGSAKALCPSLKEPAADALERLQADHDAVRREALEATIDLIAGWSTEVGYSSAVKASVEAMLFDRDANMINAIAALIPASQPDLANLNGEGQDRG